MSDDRRLDVLRAIVEDYVTTNEPVGSRALVERHALDVSPATIRNDMAVLEEAGYIAQPHTSAGRVPTDKGYRLFVDRLSSVKPLSAAERRAIATFLADAVDLDDVVDRSVRLLSQLTHQVAVVQYPSLARSALRHVELVPLEDRRILVVIITETGRVEQRIVELDEPVAEDLVPELRARLNVSAAGRRLSELDVPLSQVVEAFAVGERGAVRAVADVVRDTLAETTEERVVMAGTSNLLRADRDFPGTVRPVIEALEEQVVLLRLLTEMAEDTVDVAVRIGHENTHVGLAEASIVAAGYGADGETVARIGALGPTRMDYAGTIASVRAVARYLSRILAG
ncbi:heat-inducible transcriptional repressor HrcA [Isoptericola sp. b441]|uniref:Heat-inducible transcription repressor HrcA n=1 Tax=Actinotalea lenta TaxID=3064654 RepID=A0ABT9DEV7_9CELL|nr:heat-inducible transcriptional repressor HrcA [Isoptericola sp. b441]MDO8108118.1 heat-inducible transcriptional repressor HrcA [Isoptericola sp. b441]